ncbi:MAG: hypothetical protein AAFQ51_12455, partial [Pseudomonadota bacterium]
VIEIVTFRAAPGISEAEMAARAAGTRAAVAAMPGFRKRALSVSPDGTWTDHVEWDSLEHARAAAEQVTREPAFAPFGEAIAEGSVTMIHAHLVMTQAAVVDA